MSEHHDHAPVAAQVRGLERLLEERGLVDPAELDRAPGDDLRGDRRVARDPAAAVDSRG